MPFPVHPAGQEETIDFFLSETKHPVAYRKKLYELMGNCDMSESEARTFIANNPFTFEIYYDDEMGALFGVDPCFLENHEDMLQSPYGEY